MSKESKQISYKHHPWGLFSCNNDFHQENLQLSGCLDHALCKLRIEKKNSLTLENCFPIFLRFQR